VNRTDIPQPPNADSDTATRPRVAAVLLAAGTSTRMGAFKQLLPYRGSTIVQTCVQTLRASSADAVFVVVGHRSDEVRRVLVDEPVTIVDNTEYLDGMSSSVKAGMLAVGDSFDAVMICLCDQPHLAVSVIDAVLDAYRRSRRPIVVPQYAGDTGHPAIFDLSLRAEILAVDPTTGLRSVTYDHRADTLRVPVDTVGVLDDMDTTEDYERLR